MNWQCILKQDISRIRKDKTHPKPRVENSKA
jgi:hypothetical protein